MASLAPAALSEPTFSSKDNAEHLVTPRKTLTSANNGRLRIRVSKLWSISLSKSQRKILEER